MKELIPITSHPINEVETLTCDGRALHAFLESKQDYSTWIKNRIEKYGFVEGIDFLLHKIVEQNGRGGHNRIDHELSIDMAKQLAMVENNDKGAEVRRYFIKCERLAKEATAQPKSLPKSNGKDLNARQAAIGYRMLARMKDVYPPEMRAVFAAKSAAILTGEPLEPMLPPIKDNRSAWLSPTDLGARIGVTRNMIGRALKALELHGEDDINHEWSQPIWNKSPHSDRQVCSYLYNPDEVLSAIENYLSTSTPNLTIINPASNNDPETTPQAD